MVKNPPANAEDERDAHSILRLRKWQSTPVSFLENPMDRGYWRATVPGAAKSQIQLSD